MGVMRSSLVASLLLGLAACGGGGGSGGGGGGLEAEVNGWKDRLCKCADKACAEQAWVEYREWAKGKRAAVRKLPKDQRGRLDAIEDEASACRGKLRGGGEGGGGGGGGGSGATPPGAAPPAASPADK
jgi:hypothetical protein